MGWQAGAVGTVCFLRRRSRAKDSLDLLSEFEPASDRYAQQWAGTKTRGGKEDRLDEALLQGEAADQSMVAGRAPKPCKCCYSQWCCLGCVPPPPTPLPGAPRESAEFTQTPRDTRTGAARAGALA